MTRDIDLPDEAEKRAGSEFCNPPSQEETNSPTQPSPSETLFKEALSRSYKPVDGDFTAADMKDVLEAALAEDGAGADTLFRQAQLLDALFYRVALKAMDCPRWHLDDKPDYIDSDRLQLALRVQNLSRLALHSRHILRHGPDRADIPETDERTEGS